MSVQYVAIGWNRQKKIYDIVLVSLLALYLALFVGVGAWRNPNATAETLLIRAFGTAAFLLLHVVLCIGPLARLNPSFLPLLYNRRHLGVATFLMGLAHGGFALIQFHALGNANPLVSLFISNTRYDSIAGFPFQSLGFFALVILFLMAVTSHDFWLRNLSAPVWKSLHMLVYLAYGLLVAHVTLGALQSETSPLLSAVLIAGAATVVSLHLVTAQRERRIDRARRQVSGDGFVEVCKIDRISEKCATIVPLSGERVAVFRYDGKVSAISNVCQHQNGPLGEGKIIQGCVTCPWHGYQYQPHDGCSPAPFKEQVPTFRVKVVHGSVFVHPQPNAPGTYVEPARVDDGRGYVKQAALEKGEFYIGYLPKVPVALAGFLKRGILGLSLLIALLALVLVSAQNPFAKSTFEYGNVRSFEGYLVAHPYPTLWIGSTGEAAQSGGFSPYLLVAPGKHSADSLMAKFAGLHIRLSGQRISRGGQSMVEVVPGSIATIPADRAAGHSAVMEMDRDLGPVSVTGEIVDSKCYLGVMNPGSGKVHRDCASRCLSGGIPPIFITTKFDASGAQEQFVLVGPDGGAVAPDSLRDFIAEPMTLRAELLQRSGLRLLRIDPKTLSHSHND